MKKTAIIGASGYIGRFLIKSFRKEFPDSIGTSFSKNIESLLPFDITKQNINVLELEEHGYEDVIITSAISNIGYCELYKEKAFEINVLGLRKLFKQLAKTNIKIIFLSTDYVFDGIHGNYKENDKPNPLTEYGRHKLQMEKELSEIAENYLILRLSKVYGVDKGDKTFLDDIAHKLFLKETVLAAHDQFFCPTYINDLIQAIHVIQKKNIYGLVHLCGPEICNRFDIAKELASKLNVNKDLVQKIKLYDLPIMTNRPLNTTLNSDKLRSIIPMEFTSIQNNISQIAENFKI